MENTGNVFEFGSGKRLSQAAEDELKAKTVLDDTWVREHPNAIAELMKAQKRLGYFFMSLPPGGITPEDIRARQRAFAHNTLEQLSDILLASDTEDWQRDPVYYGALLLESEERARLRA